MLIKVKPSAPREERGMGQAKYVMRQGMARVAERMKAGDPYQTSVYGQQLPHAKEMAERHGFKQIEAWGRGATKVVIGSAGARRTPWPWEGK